MRYRNTVEYVRTLLAKPDIRDNAYRSHVVCIYFHYSIFSLWNTYVVNETRRPKLHLSIYIVSVSTISFIRASIHSSYDFDLDFACSNETTYTKTIPVTKEKKMRKEKRNKET